MYWSKCSEGRWLLACMDSLLYIIDLQRYQHSTLDVLCINKMYWSWKQSRSWYRNTELTKPRRSLNTNSCVCRLLKRFFLGEHLIAPTIWSDHRSLLHPVIARLQRPCNHSAIWWWHRWSCKWWWWSDDGVLLHACSRQTCTMGQVSLSSALNRPDGEQLQRTSMCLKIF